MEKIIGIRREDKNIWEVRVPLIPEHTKVLADKYGIKTVVQSFDRRAFSDDDYKNTGCEINENLESCKAIFGVKEVPVEKIIPNKIYIFFAHVIKGQPYNMNMLKDLMDKGCTLIDYECIKDKTEKRLVFFGKFAGYAGMIDALYGLGRRMKSLGFSNLLEHIKPAFKYHDLLAAKDAIEIIGDEIKNFGLPKEFAPYVFGFTGYGNVSNGAQEVFDMLPFEEVMPEDLKNLSLNENKKLYKVIFREEHMVKPSHPENSFELFDYFKHPEKYVQRFNEFIPYLSVIINAVYWDDRYPRLLSIDYLRKNPKQKLMLVSDISCDIEGSIQFTRKSTKPDNPAFVYNPNTDEITDGFDGEGIVDMAVDNLPAELPRDSSTEFSRSLMPFVDEIISVDLNKDFDEAGFPEEIKRAVIVYKGELTPNYEYLEKHLNK
jgi:alpha-aminoadipic semialdehyde synthase